jgi:cell wall assembly regulator SMI1
VLRINGDQTVNELNRLMKRLSMLHKRIDDISEEETKDNTILKQETIQDIEQLEDELKEKYPYECNFAYQN